MKITHSRKARIEYLAIEKKAEELFQKGHSFRSAYKIFYDGHKITMSYDTFRRYALGLFTRMDQIRQKCTTPSSSVLKSSKSANDSAASPPVKQASEAASSDNAASAPARSGPKILGRKKSMSFGEDVIDLADLFGTKTE